MINLCGRIAANTVEEAAAQIPDDVADGYKLWFVGLDAGLKWFEWRGWRKAGDANGNTGDD